jgi:hypothetical protein
MKSVALIFENPVWRLELLRIPNGRFSQSSTLTRQPQAGYCSLRSLNPTLLLTSPMISSKDCAAAPSTFSNEPFSSGLPNRQMMMFAAAALRANFLAVNAARPAVTSSTKQTQIVSALSISVSMAGNAGIEPFTFQNVRNDQRDAIVETAQTRNAEHRFSKLARVKFRHFICRLCTTDCLRLDCSVGADVFDDL